MEGNPTAPDALGTPWARPLDLMGEFIGSEITLERAPGWAVLPWSGIVVDETRNTFRVRPIAGGSARVLPKSGLVGTLRSEDGRAVRFKGDELRHRPEDRIKRLAPRGRGRRS